MIFNSTNGLLIPGGSVSIYDSGIFFLSFFLLFKQFSSSFQQFALNYRFFITSLLLGWLAIASFSD
jgi:hypothetical protein